MRSCGQIASTTFPAAWPASPVPHLAGMFMEAAHDDPESILGWYDDQTEFEFGLDIILDGLDRLRDRA